MWILNDINIRLQEIWIKIEMFWPNNAHIQFTPG